MLRRSLGIALVLGLVAAACGDSSEGVGTGDCDTVDNVKVQLQWVAQSQFAGYFVADDLDFYGDECLNVQILEGAPDIVPQTVLASGGSEFALAWVPKALESNEQGADIVNVAQVFERSGTLEVSFADSGISSPQDWAGKKVGVWPFGNEYEITAAVSQLGVADVEYITQGFDMLALLNGEIDAAEAMIYNEYAQVLEAKNPATGQLYQPSDFNVIDTNDIGTAMLQDAVWANRSWLEDSDNEDIAKRFLKATFRGWIHCIDNFDDCVEVVLDNGSTLGSSHQAWQLNEILGLIFPATNGIGVMNTDLWEQTLSVATSEIPGLQGVTVSDDTYRTDIAEDAIKALENDGLDVRGANYDSRTITLNPGGE